MLTNLLDLRFEAYPVAVKTLLLILALAITASAQSLDWKHVGSGPTVELYVAEIARGPKQVKFWLRWDFPNGAPDGLLPVNGVSSIHAEATFDCVKQTAKLTNGYGFFYDAGGNLIKKAKDKETVKGMMPGSVGNYVLEYFCERGEKPTKAPTLKP
jgi:hypothetical protein